MSLMRVKLLAVLGLLVGCSSASSPDAVSDGGGATSPESGVDASAPEPPPAPHPTSDALRACATKSGDVRTIAEAITRFNALVPTTDAACFLATLPRPLSVVATTGLTSAQPAGGKDSPRMFFLSPTLVISAVPDGAGSKAVEFGEWVTPTRTIKGEIALPVQTPLAPGAAFERILFGKDADRTACATCHRYEERSPTVPGAFVSAAYKPEPGTFVTVAELRRFHDACIASSDTSPRCEMFHAVFDFGEVRQGAFGSEVETFFIQR